MYFQRNFNRGLDLDRLGFDNLEDFLEILKKIITLRKVTNYYLLLPKHSEIPLDGNKSELSSVGILKLPVSYSQKQFVIPTFKIKLKLR